MPTETNAPAPTSTRLPKPTVAADVVSQASWGDDSDGWVVGGSWSWLDGMIVSDGSDSGWVAPQFEVPSEVSEFAVEAEVRMLSLEIEGCETLSFQVIFRVTSTVLNFGQVTRNGCGETALVFCDGGFLCSDAAEIDVDTEWHTYRIELTNLWIDLFVDDQSVLRVRNRQDTVQGIVGLGSHLQELEARSFKVIDLG